MRNILFLFMFFACVQVPAQTARNNRFTTYIDKLPAFDLPAYCPFYGSEHELAPEDSVFYSLPESADSEISFGDVSASTCIKSGEKSFFTVFFAVGKNLMDICTYHPDGRFIDHLIIPSYNFRDNVIFTEDYVLRTVANIGTEEKPVFVEKRYRIDTDGKFRTTETVNYIEEARPWVETSRQLRKEEAERLAALLAESTPEEANSLYERRGDFFTSIDGDEWFERVDRLNFSRDDEYEENSDFWSTLKAELYYFLYEARYIPLNNTSYHELFAKYVTEEYREALELYIIDDYVIEDSEELRVNMEDIPVWIIDREEYAARYPVGRHSPYLLRGCLSYLKSFLFCDGINTSVFSHRDNFLIDDGAMDVIATTAKNHPDSKLAAVIRFFLKEMEKTHNCYTEQLEETVMQFAKNLYSSTF